MAIALPLTCCGEALAQQPAGPVLCRKGRVAQAHHQEAELVPAPRAATRQPYRFAPIGEVTLDTSTTPGLTPPDLAAEVLGRNPPLVLAPGMTRPWPPQVFCWYGVPLHYAPVYDGAPGYDGYAHHRGAGCGLRCAGRVTEASSRDIQANTSGEEE